MTEPDALVILEDYSCVGGVFTEPADHEVTATELEAIDYLCAEWDYGYAPRSET